MEILNEILTLTIMYHIFCFTDFVSDPDIRYYLGYSCLVLNFNHLGLNMGFVVRDSIKGVANGILVQIAIYKMKKTGRKKTKQKFKHVGKTFALKVREERENGKRD